MEMMMRIKLKQRAFLILRQLILSVNAVPKNKMEVKEEENLVAEERVKRAKRAEKVRNLVVVREKLREDAEERAENLSKINI